MDFKIVEGLYYSEDHEWVKVDGDVATIGLSDYAQDHLGDIVYIELPEVDDELDTEDPFTAVESVKAAADMYSPVSGKVVEVNEELEDAPESINADPYENWIVKVEMSNKAELEELMSSEEYEKLLAEEE